LIRRSQHITGSIARLSDTVTIQTIAVTDDGMGGQDSVWIDVLSRFALVEAMPLNERVQAESVIGEVSHRVTMRELTQFEAERFAYLDAIASEPGSVTYQAGLPGGELFASGGVVKLGAVLGYTSDGPKRINSAQYRLVWRGRELSIQSVYDMGNRGEYVQLMCREVTP
jgi:head-tail adaptor